MPETVKYTFDQAFDGGAKSRYDMEVADLRKQIDVARREGFEKGIETGRDEIRKGVELQMKELFGSIAVQLSQFQQDHNSAKMALEADMTKLCYGLANKLSRGLLDANPTIGVEELCKEAIDALIDIPTLTLRIPDSFDDAFCDTLSGIAEANGYRGKLEIEKDSRLTPPDCQLLWAKGQAVLTQDRLEAEVTGLVSAYLNRLTPQGKTPQGDTEHV